LTSSRRSLILADELAITMLGFTHDMRMVRELFPRMVIMDRGVVADGRRWI
jgi:ABC-type dipeptide/oligopeptide/nickel transport system ATPase subunit